MSHRCSLSLFQFFVSKNPLCVFCLSPPFSIRAFTRPPERSASRRLSVRCWRRGGSSLLSVRPRFKAVNRRSSNSLTKYLSGFFQTRARRGLTLQEVLEEIRKAWNPQSYCTMDEKWSKSNSNETLSPVLLRRRLSAPETIMRKHMLAQQRSDSQDSEIAQSEAKIYTYRGEMDAGSDSNLNRKRDPDLMRKTTLLRRLWSHTKPLPSTRFSGTFHEWQHSYGKLCSGRSTHSLTSVHSSPEHLVKSQSRRSLNESRTSPQHKNINSRRLSPKHQKRHFETDSTTTTKTSTTTTPKTTTETETSTRYTNTSYTTFSDNSDSAYTNSNSNYTETSNNNSTPSEIRKDVLEDTEASNQGYHLRGANETATQTIGTTNVNVISNVQLSQSTLDLIFNQVMQDVKNSSDVSSESNIVQVKQIPSFYLKRKDSEDNSQHSRIVKCMISNVGAGSPYSKPPEAPQIAVPRFSARPQTSSMEVNISSGESTDKESDTVSLVDSLEDTSSLRTDPMQNEVIANKSDISLELPDNSDKKPSKPTAFFIPIEIDSRTEFKPVSDHLPQKVRDRLVRRQQKREERNRSKQSSSRSDSNYISASENGNHIHCIVHNGADINLNSVPLPEVNYGKSKKRSKPLLPSIESFRRIKIDDQKSVKRKSIKDENYTKSKQKLWVPKVRNKNEKLTPLYTSKNEYVYDCGPRRIYHKTEFNNTNKRIEILEIMECVDNSEKLEKLSKKSKIPVLVNQKLPKINQKQSKAEKPAFLDLDCVPITDPKLDQLIANILIETLNIPDIQASVSGSKSPVQESQAESAKAKFSQKFDAIPEELSFQSSTENDVSNNNDVNPAEEKSAYQGKAAVAVVKDENFSSIPKGWITFYMLHNNRGSPDSTSDEGKKLADKKNESKQEIESGNNNDLTSAYSNVTYDVVKKDKYESNGNCSSSSEIPAKTLPPTTGRYKKYNQRKIRHKVSETEKVKQFGEWSVTVSGTNSYGQFAPDLEMSLKFPDSQKNYTCPSQSDSGLGEDNEKSHFPKIGTKQDQYKEEDENNEFMKQRLPDIARTKMGKKQRRSDSSVPSLGNLSSRIEPRQTRTSTRRYNLSRPKIDYQKSETPRNAISLFNDSHYAEILKRFPEILSITGNAINQGKK
ncbi:uncharacterized protein LOC103314649 isoform X3 [Tribolium castaneum]|uniref:Uncharacterized protein n=1 Tax=Tribolium castaneum TaxID=7070 RepID=A0A139WPI3_TRICA|nr:PREDICTED: uncharacterized protein LOC103314649 isoform X1 [Tribolium castaneum]XP_015834064.1 PREDICTED: uncharacterized protein LOC103314649 isoform X1 [Tribolium castaneum]KYB29786.1 hypothetical protein TcasGA2_TC031532 [Tribolium castaneum]|eukprot:XP_008199374.2 PREDICTED: uncharacterized protein LOC103314649 isoform X1 [Tribolium castaneum]